MSLRRAKNLYCLSVISIAVALTCTGGLIEWIIAVVMLTGALPMFTVVRRATAQSALIGFRRDLEATPHNQPTDPASGDRKEVHRST